MEPRSKFIDVNGVKLHVADWGGRGPVVFLVHANGFLGWVYRAVIARLVGMYHVLTMDLRGQGDSPRPVSDEYHWQSLAADVEGVIEQLGVRSQRILHR
jgi:haloacetate dehalogenase